MATPLYPLRFAPFLRPMPWGGHRLRQWLDTPWPEDAKIGEAWLLSDHPLHQSVVTNGRLKGMTLSQLMAERSAELLGYQTNRFPLLVKLLDAEENLSIQVHPDDGMARRWAPLEGGKSEAWLVLESSPKAAIYLGLKPGIDRTTLLRELGNGTLPLCLRRYDPQPGECYNVPAGSIHALGGGTVILEVQQTSDATFRLFDWNRVNDSGKPRPLHLEAGLACMKEVTPGMGKQLIRSGVRREETLVEGPFFRMRRWRQTAQLQGPCMLICLGESAILSGDGASHELRKGELWLVPAVTRECQLSGINGDVIAVQPLRLSPR